uniref:Uncharacterized protein n=1 Tax=Lates calcarifer TaxID=8187 RepID=A0A4W6FWY8_LATCA
MILYQDGKSKRSVCERRHCSTEMWGKMIWSDESPLSIFSTSEQVHVWRTPRGQYRPECLNPTMRGSSDSGMLWGAFCWHGLGPLVPLERLQVNVKSPE